MAFNSKSPKFPIVYESDIKEQGMVGPGLYQTIKSTDFVTNHAAQCVFKSSIYRSLPADEAACPPEVGPGQYDFQQAYKHTFKSKVTSCETSFRSKIVRFPKKNSEDKTKMSQSLDNLNIYSSLLERDQINKKNGKLYGINRDHSKIDLTIPSIPSAEQSYGYKVDQQSKKLVRNQDPHVLLERKIFENAQSCLFNATQSIYSPQSIQNLNKIKAPMWHKDSKPEKKENQLDQSNIINKNYQDILQEEMKLEGHVDNKWKQKGMFVAKQERFKQGGGRYKAQLLQKVMRKKFKDFIGEDQNLQNIIDNRFNQNKSGEIKQNKFGKHPIKTQCFLAKQNRFSVRKQNSQSSGVVSAQNITSIIEQQSIKKNYGGFSSKRERFEQGVDKGNSKLGPGTYFGDEQQKLKRPRKGTKLQIIQ